MRSPFYGVQLGQNEVGRESGGTKFRRQMKDFVLLDVGHSIDVQTDVAEEGGSVAHSEDCGSD
jgi:hypothetical protein